MAHDLILASSSRYRQELLARLGFTFRAFAPPVDEAALREPSWSPRETAERLALAKAESLALLHPKAIIIGADQVVSCAGQILGKPGTREAALEQLTLLQGRQHQLLTALVVLRGAERFPHTDVTELTMRSLTPAELAAYVDADEPFDCAGAYKLECRGITLFERIRSDDHTAIVGLPLIALTSILRRCGLVAA
jgi:septum formation protein